MFAEFDKKPILLQSRRAPWMQRPGQASGPSAHWNCLVNSSGMGHLVMPGAARPLMYPIIRLTECPKNLLPPLAWTRMMNSLCFTGFGGGNRTCCCSMLVRRLFFFLLTTDPRDEQSDSIQPCPQEGLPCWANKSVYLLDTHLLLVSLRSHATQLTFQSFDLNVSLFRLTWKKLQHCRPNNRQWKLKKSKMKMQLTNQDSQTYPGVIWVVVLANTKPWNLKSLTGMNQPIHVHKSQLQLQHLNVGLEFRWDIGIQEFCFVASYTTVRFTSAFH